MKRTPARSRRGPKGRPRPDPYVKHLERLNVLAIRMSDFGRVLPGIFSVAADGRPAFSSQAAADFVNALNAFDAERAGTSAEVNRAPRM